MIKSITSAIANKYLKALEDEKRSILTRENNGKSYTLIEGVSPEIPNYNFLETRMKINEINRLVMDIKHCINIFNTNTIVLPDVTLDMALVRMAQLSNELSILEYMKDAPATKTERGYTVPAAHVRNYDAEEAVLLHRKTKSELSRLQLAVDKANLTIEFDVDFNVDIDLDNLED